MNFSISDQNVIEIETDCLVVGYLAGSQQPGITAINEATGGLVDRLKQAGDLPSDSGKTLMLHAIDGIAAQRLLIIGMGKAEKLDGNGYVKAIRQGGKALRNSRARRAHCLLAEIPVPGRELAWKSLQAALALDHANYVYSATKQPKDSSPPPTEEVSFPAAEGLTKVLDRATAIAAGIQRCRDLADLPPNIATPVYLAETARAMGETHDGLEVEILDEQQMADLGMRALLAVGQGSANPSRLIRLSWRGGAPNDQPYVLVGKGVTFDTGGISIKPRDNMDQMKFDMGGAAATIGTLEAVARLKLPINVEGVVAAVENMPDGKAYRPGDVITAMNGKTIEVLNTDAEGRMILADALTWSQQFKPAAMVDIATLTGACVVALGHHASGLMTQDDELAEELLAAGIESADRAWRLPLWDDYQEQIETPFADMKNIGGMPAGSITAGCFLARFAEGQRWAHLDIAGSAWRWGKAESASGRPVGLLTEWLIGRSA